MTFSFTNLTESGWIVVENNSNVIFLRDTIFAASYDSCEFFQNLFLLSFNGIIISLKYHMKQLFIVVVLFHDQIN